MKKVMAPCLFCFFCLLVPLCLYAQDDQDQKASVEKPGPKKFWQADMPGGSYVVALDKISSVSKHTYITEGALRITEVVIDTDGNSLARFYYIMPLSEGSASSLGTALTNRGKELLEKAGERGGVSASTEVIKQYPTTTHAKTVEFRMPDEKTIVALFYSVKNAWMRSSGRRFTVKN